MADPTYNNQAVYMKQGGNEQVVASTGLITVEDGGKIKVESGGIIELEDGGLFEFYNDTQISAEKMFGICTRGNSVTIMHSAGVLSDQGAGSYPPILPSIYGTIWLSTNQSNMSARLPSARCGQVLYIRYTIEGGESVCSIWLFGSAGCGLSGALIMLSTGSDASSIILNNSAASMGFVKLYGVKDGTWAVEDQKQATEQASS